MKPKKPKPLKVKRRYPLHAVFLIYCLVSLLVAVGAFNANNNLLFWLFGLSMGMLLVSGVVSGSMMMSIRVERLPIEQQRVGQALRIRYSITNRSRWLPVIGLNIAERVDTASSSVEKTAVLAAPPAGAVAHVPARSTLIVETLAMPTARGRLRLSGFEVLTTFPFGIIRKSLWHEAPVSLIVHSGDAPLPDSLIDPASGLLGSGAAATRPGRLGDEPVGLREYRPGDAPKLVAWRASAKRPGGDLLVRQNAEGSPRRLWVLLRLSHTSTPFQTESALAVAASVVRVAASHGLRVGLSLRTDWEDKSGRGGGGGGGGGGVPTGFELPPRTGNTGGVLLNDLALLHVPAATQATLTPQEEPRLASGDLVVRIGPTGQLATAAEAGPTRFGPAGRRAVAAAGRGTGE